MIVRLRKTHIGFDALKNKLAHRPGVTDPAALAAAIGRKKYGAEKMEEASREHKPANKVLCKSCGGDMECPNCGPMEKTFSIPPPPHEIAGHIAKNLQDHLNKVDPYAKQLPFRVSEHKAMDGSHQGYKVTRPMGAGGHASARITPSKNGRFGIPYARRSNHRGDNALAQQLHRHLETYAGPGQSGHKP